MATPTPRFTSTLHDERVAAWLGVALGLTFTTCFATGLRAHPPLGPSPEDNQPMRHCRRRKTQDLKRHAPMERGVVRKVHQPHSAASEPALDLIAAERYARLDLGTDRLGVLKHLSGLTCQAGIVPDVTPE